MKVRELQRSLTEARSHREKSEDELHEMRGKMKKMESSSKSGEENERRIKVCLD